MTTSKRTKAPTTPGTSDADPEIEEPVLYWTGQTPKAGLPERDLFATDIAKRSKEALIQTGAYTDVKPGATEAAEPEAESEEPEA